jgi:hypothetical protein
MTPRSSSVILLGGADGEEELLGGGQRGVDLELDAEPSVGGVVPAGDLQHAAVDVAVVSGGAVEGVVVDVFADVAHGREPGQRGVESRDRFVDLVGRRGDVGAR